MYQYLKLELILYLGEENPVAPGPCSSGGFAVIQDSPGHREILPREYGGRFKDIDHFQVGQWRGDQVYLLIEEIIAGSPIIRSFLHQIHSGAAVCPAESIGRRRIGQLRCPCGPAYKESVQRIGDHENIIGAVKLIG